MPAFRKKPVVIEAVQFDGTYESCDRIEPLSPGSFECLESYPMQLRVTTREGRMIAQPGDWIIKDVKGEVYPCKPDIFAATYEPA